MAKNVTSRRRVLKGGLAAAGLGLFGLPEWAMPVLAQGETLVPFTRLPGELRHEPERGRPRPRHPDDRRRHSRRTISSSRRSTTAIPTIDPAAFRLKVSGLVDRPKSLSIDELKAMGKDGGRRRLRVLGQRPRPHSGLRQQRPVDRRAAARRCSKEAGLKHDGHEVVFFGADHGEEEVEFRQQKYQARPGSSAAACRASRRSAPIRCVAYAHERRAADQAPGRAAAPHRARAGTASRTSSGCRTSTSSATPSWASTSRAGTGRCARRRSTAR